MVSIKQHKYVNEKNGRENHERGEWEPNVCVATSKSEGKDRKQDNTIVKEALLYSNSSK